MGSPFFSPFWLANCSTRSKDNTEKFRNDLNKEHKTTKSILQTEKNNLLSFLDIKISRGNDKIVSSVYRKPKFSGIFTNFENLE